MNPDVIKSPDFGQLFRTTLPGNFGGLAAEQVFASPLVYTANDGVQYVYVATTQNNLYKINARSGEMVASRNLHVPFLQVELESTSDTAMNTGFVKLTWSRLCGYKSLDRHHSDGCH